MDRRLNELLYVVCVASSPHYNTLRFSHTPFKFRFFIIRNTFLALETISWIAASSDVSEKKHKEPRIHETKVILRSTLYTSYDTVSLTGRS